MHLLLKTTQKYPMKQREHQKTVFFQKFQRDISQLAYKFALLMATRPQLFSDMYICELVIE